MSPVLGSALDPVAELVEALDVELVDHSVLAAEAAVEAHRRAAGLGGDPTHG